MSTDECISVVVTVLHCVLSFRVTSVIEDRKILWSLTSSGSVRNTRLLSWHEDIQNIVYSICVSSVDHVNRY